MCGRALGGHMRAHGIGVDDAADVYDDEDATSDWEAGAGNSGGGGVGSNKRMYALRTNPNRTRNRACDNCGKEFLSWKSFLEHSRCCGGGGSEEEEEDEDDESPAASSPSSDNGDGWLKRKRTFRSEVESTNFTVNDYNIANCLMMLSNATVDPTSTAVVVDQPEESSASAERHPINFSAAPLASWAPPPPTKGLFECKACKKVFNSHQALGGHRASHKKVKGCFAARLDPVESDRVSNFFDDQTGTPINNNSPKRIKGTKVHECSICHRVFNSGQALGGHKRCHWITPANSTAAVTLDPTLARFQQLQHGGQQQQEERRVDGSAGLDLNILPGQIEDPKNVLSLKVSTEFFLNYEENMKNVISAAKTKNNDTNDNSLESFKANVDDEADSKMKMAKLSELKEMNVAGCSAPWLQVGIGSANNGGEL
ncbi:hypothetical protein V2J09_015263 [Rumex salicifolius]